MMIKVLWLFLLISIISGLDLKPHNQDDYIDPFDMFNYDISNARYREKKYSEDGNGIKDAASIKENINGQPQVPVDKDLPPVPVDKDSHKMGPAEGLAPPGYCDAACKPCEATDCLEGYYMKQYIRTILTNFLVDSVTFDVPKSYQMTMTVNEDDIAVLKRYSSSSKGSIQDVSDVLGDMVKHVSVLDQEYQEPLFDLEQFIVNSQQIVLILQMVGVVALVVIIFYLEAHIHLSWTQQTKRLVIICFLISVPWNWLHLYKKAAARKLTEVIKGIPDECRPSDTSWLSSMNSWYRTTFTFMENKCDKYHEALMVDPFWEVSPFQAIAVSLSAFIFEPAGHFGDAISKFFRGLLQHVPIQWAVPLFLAVIIIAVLILFMMFGYRIKIPFLAAIEPAERITSCREQELLKQIHTLEDTNTRLHERIPRLSQTSQLKIDNVGTSRQGASDQGFERSLSCDSIPSAIGHENQRHVTHDVRVGLVDKDRDLDSENSSNVLAVQGQGDGSSAQVLPKDCKGIKEKVPVNVGARTVEPLESVQQPGSIMSKLDALTLNNGKQTVESTRAEEISDADNGKDLAFLSSDFVAIGPEPVVNGSKGGHACESGESVSVVEDVGRNNLELIESGEARE
ncbi:chloride channel CLIC-like protein 1 [Lineus longissimus]|uniref:chloride channel CLIC-like protein 1 n=1 Tax=Lineus longissimus TaxID=88925 RepID=UPI002B4C2925